MKDSLLSPQKVLGRKGLIFLVFLLNMTGPMSTDMYLAAFPTLVNEFNTTSSMLNFTLVGFFISFAIGILFIGPISDKIGRKPILISGILVYGISSYLCSLANSIEILIFFRITQAIGAGGMIAVSTAMVKEAFNDNDRPEIIALLQMLGVFAPTVAPLIGAQIIQYSSWKSTFEFLTFLSVISLIVSLLLSETLQKEKRLKGNVLQSILSLKEVIFHKPFMTFLVAMGGTSLIYMSFLAVSSYIYIDWFGLNATQYSLFFAFNSLLLMIGPKVYLSLRKRFTSKQIIKYTFTVIIISALLIIFIGIHSPYLFLLSFAPITLSGSFLRAFSSNILLAQKEMNAGGAASIINFSNTTLGAIGMLLGTLNWGNYVYGVGFIAVIGSVFSVLLWMYFNKKKYILDQL